MKDSGYKTVVRERNLTAVIKVLLILILVAAGLGISTLLGEVTGGGKLVLAVCGALGGIFSMLMGSIAKARIDLRKMKAGVRVKSYRRRKGVRLLNKVTLSLAGFVYSEFHSEIDKSVKKNKAETITELFLFDKQSDLNAAKKIALWGLVVNAIMYLWIDLPFATTGLFLGIIALLQIKEEILVYRVNQGYFGSTTREAMMLIKFINAQDDDSDMNAGGRRKPVFKNVAVESAEDVGDFVGIKR
ncbi:TPA: hypothetical protein QHX51_000409 [Enterobacter asburiae]|nr:hypothetical protein [Enterobacter asburiae]HDS6497337.1 hypothetical protein [Enterobacter asburiae]